MISLVTGGTGYLGSRLVEALLAKGDEVRVLHRSTSDLKLIPSQAIRREGDILLPATLEHAAEGCDRIFHTAALVKTWVPDNSLFDKINVEGTRNVCGVAHTHGCRLIYTSSFFALGPTGPEPVDESHQHPTPTFCTTYERTKTLAHAVVMEALRNGLDAVILYPGLIYGPGPMTQGNHVTLLARDLARKRLPGIPGDGKQVWTFAYIEDVVKGHLAAAEHASTGSDYILGGPLATVDEAFEILGRLLAVKPPRLHVPIGVLKVLGWVSEWVARVTGISPQVTREVAEAYRHHWAYDSSKAMRDLGYTFRPLEEGLTEVAKGVLGRS
jgi:NAD+-dependent farnesol dehydrogenase